ncbi:hypothetical protein Goklo_029646, partial [Gossypium klotzschianum]|nr:hypothetical protein [Gossypium klotzschianum]
MSVDGFRADCRPLDPCLSSPQVLTVLPSLVSALLSFLFFHFSTFASSPPPISPINLAVVASLRTWSSLCQHLSQAVDDIAISLVFKGCDSSISECMASVLVISTTPYWCMTLSKGLRGWVIFSLTSKGLRIGVRFFWIGTR